MLKILEMKSSVAIAKFELKQSPVNICKRLEKDKTEKNQSLN